MGKLYYHNTFLDEMPATTDGVMIKSASCPAIMASVQHCKSRMFDQWHSKLQLAMLNSMSEGLTHQRVDWNTTFGQMEVPSEGSCGHPDLCGRPCVHFVHGKCKSGADCAFCHHYHPCRAPSFDKKQRDYMQNLSVSSSLAILLPYVRKNVENNELMNAAPLLELFEREISIRSYSGPKTADKSGHKVPHKISQVLERMPISSLVGVACRRQGKGHFPRLLQKAMKDIRSDLSGTDYMSW